MADQPRFGAWTGPARNSLIRAAFAAILGLAATVPAGAESVPIRVGTHAGYGRIVFAWSSAVGHKAEIRAEYGEAMAKSELAKGFDLIAGQSALTGVGRADVPGEVEEAQGFQTFLSAYKERLREQGLSSIN